MGALRTFEVHRRGLLAGAGGVLATVALAPATGFAQASAVSGAESWIGYDARLRALLDQPPGGGFQTNVEARILAETNRFRGEHALPLLKPHEGLDRVARAAAADMATRNFFDHHSPEGHAPSERVGLLARELCGASGENIAYQEGGDAPTGRTFFEQWRESPGHRENMLRSRYTHAGHGVVTVGERTYAVATFAEEQVRLGAEPPLRLQDDQALSAAMSRAAPAFERFQVSAPDGSAMSSILSVGELGGLPSGAWRLRPHLPDGERRFLVLWGPIFVAG